MRKGGVERSSRCCVTPSIFRAKDSAARARGLFEGFDRRRDAVDGFWPTIRAAADPITRELYLSLASQRSGVSKDVLEDELRQGERAHGSGAAVRAVGIRPALPHPTAPPT